MKKALSLFLSLVMILIALPLTGLNSSAYYCGYYEYELDGNNAVITRYNDHGEYDIVIPDELDSHPVTVIGEGAFYANNNLVYLTIPDSVEEVRDSAFQDCNNLESVIIGDGVSYIGAAAFSACYNLASVTFGSSLITIDDGAFAYTSLTSLTIPEGVTSLGEGVFEDCDLLAEINLPASLTSIGKASFRNNAALTDVYYPSTEQNMELIAIDNTYAYNDCLIYAVWHCTDGDVTHLRCGDTAYYTYKPATGEVFIYGTGALYSSDNMAAPLRGNLNITSAVIGEGITSIGDSFFRSCKNLLSVSFPETLKSIGRYAFNECEAIETLTLPDGLETMEEYAFSHCFALSVVNFPSGVTTLGNGLFHRDFSLTDVYCSDIDYYYTYWDVISGIDNYIKNANWHFIDEGKLGDNVYFYSDTFYDTIYVTGTGSTYDFDYFEQVVFYKHPEKNLVIEEGVTRIGEYTFNGLSNVTNVSLPDSLVSVEYAAFPCFTEVDHLTLPKNMSNIAYRAFLEWDGAQYLIIPETVTGIQDDFSEWNSLQYIFCYKGSYGDNINPSKTTYFGDLNSDGYIDLTDYSRMVSELDGTGSELTWVQSMVADCNLDGAVDAFDLFRIDKMINNIA